jgi:large subunit ribosomal protein L13
VRKTYSAKAEDIERTWYVVDAEGKTLGRLATEVARILRGKHKPIYTPHVDTGDYVIIVNADKVRVTGKRLDQKKYYRHSGYMGGLKETTLRTMLDKHPERVLQLAVKGMMPKNRLGRKMFKKLKVYATPDHPHAAQKPQPMEL